MLAVCLFLGAVVLFGASSKPQDPFSCFQHLKQDSMVLGLTPECFLYYGNVKAGKRYESTAFLERFGDACRKKHAFIVRSYGEAQHMLVVVDRYGRRVRVQPALSKDLITPPSSYNKTDVVIHFVDPRNRLEQFYSDTVDRGFVIAGFYYFKYRVLVFALSHYAVRFYDLRLHIGKKYITPHLELLSEPDLQLILPRDFKVFEGGVTSDSSESLTVDVQHGRGAPFSISLKGLVFNSYTGFRVTTAERKAQSSFQHRMHCPQKVGNFYFFKNSKKLRPDLWMLDISNRRWLNPLNSHRRMSYPHAIKRMEHRKFLARVWSAVLPIVSANVLLLLFGTVVFLRLVGFYNREHRRNKFVLDSSVNL
ncbi:hypothetical protein RB195_001198 [Necator americanus]|uniref:Uncharacterized protein n=1 Tax=Necator americanus TaxID=51031 RepID=A0ABR1DD77_NECAM